MSDVCIGFFRLVLIARKPIGKSRSMNVDDAICALSALAQATRLETFRLLVRREPDGLSTGELIAATGLTQSTFSTHLAVFAKAELVASEKRGRRQTSSAEWTGFATSMLFLARLLPGPRGALRAAARRTLLLLIGAAAMAVDVTIYHNPDCGTSRNVLGLIRNAGIEPQIIEYLKTPPSRERAGGADRAHAASPCATCCAGRARPMTSSASTIRALTDDQLLDAMMAHPILINRPHRGHRSGREALPPVRSRARYPAPPQRGVFTKEDGERWWMSRAAGCAEGTVMSDTALPKRSRPPRSWAPSSAT